MKMKKKMSVLGALILSLALLVAGCGTGGGTAGNKNPNGNPSADGKIELSLWHTWGTKNAGWLQAMADDFNSSQDKYTVVLVNQQSAGTIRQKLSTLKQDSYPAIFCGQPTATSYYNSVSYIKPLQDFVDADDTDWTADIYQSVKDSYSNLEGRMLGAPFGVSCNGYFVNVDLIRQAGYSLEDMTSFEKIAEIAKAVTAKGLCKYGIAFYSTGVELPDMLTVQGVDLVDAENGYAGEPTKSLLSEGETHESASKAVKLIASLYEAGVAYPYGADTAGETMPSFYNGNLAICMATNSWSHYIVDNGTEFEYAFVPAVGVDEKAANSGSALVEGTGLYICDTGNDEQMQGAYKFIKFLAEPKQQAYWCCKLGYVPYTDEAVAQETYTEWVNSNFPSLVELREKIKASKLRGSYTAIPDEILSACNEMLSYVAADPKGDLEAYIQDAGQAIEEGFEIQALRRQ